MRFGNKVKIKSLPSDAPEAYGEVCNVNDDWITIIIKTDILYKKHYSRYDLEIIDDLPTIAKGTNN